MRHGLGPAQPGTRAPLDAAKSLLGLVGADGFGREVMRWALDLLRNSAQGSMVDAVFVVDGAQQGSVADGVPVISPEAFLARPGRKEFNVVATGDTKARERIARRFIEAGARPLSLFAANSRIQQGSDIGAGAILCPFTMVMSNARIGRFFHAKTFSYVAHDCVVGDFVTFATGVKCNRGVTVEDHAYIGTGAEIKRGIIIGRSAIVNMGAVVVRDVPAGATVAGNPATPRSDGYTIG